MSNVVDCLDGIIGLTRKECECFDTIETQSESGLFVEDLVGVSDVFSIIDCPNGSDVAEIMSNSFEKSKYEFYSDFNAMFLNYNKPRRKLYTGAIGKASYKNTLNITTGKYYGVRLYCADVVSGYMKINSIGGIFTKTGTVDLTIVNNLGEEVETVTINTVANKHTTTDVDIELPLHNDYINNLEYFIYYTADGDYLPKDNEVRCGVCGGFKQIYNTRNPLFASQTGSQIGWQQWCMAGGLNLNSTVDFMNVDTTANTYMYGLTLSVEFGCRSSYMVCQNITNVQDNPMAMAIAHAINYKTAANIINSILASNIINRETMINREEKFAVVTQYLESYKTILQYIVDNIELTYSDCYICKDKFETIKGLI